MHIRMNLTLIHGMTSVYSGTSSKAIYHARQTFVCVPVRTACTLSKPDVAEGFSESLCNKASMQCTAGLVFPLCCSSVGEGSEVSLNFHTVTIVQLLRILMHHVCVVMHT